MKRTILRRCLSLLLSVMLLVSGMPLTAFAQEDGADTELSSGVQPAEEVQLPEEDTEAAKEESGPPTEEMGSSAEEAGQPIEEMDGSSEEPDQATGEAGQAAEGQAQEGSATAAALDIMPASSTADVIDLSDSDAALEAASGGKYSYNAGTKVVTIHFGPVTVTGSTMEKHVVIEGTTAVTLDNVSISPGYGKVPLALSTGANVIISLQGKNVLKAGHNTPGLLTTSSSLTIQAADESHSLVASSDGFAAGIGGHSHFGGGDITVEGGTIIATGSHQGAGIGGGVNGAGGTINITGGTVIATGNSGGAGIGGGLNGSGGVVTITGGTVIATANTINDRTGKDIGPGDGGTDGTITITGGSVNPTRGNVSPQPTNGTASVYLNTLIVGNPGVGDGVAPGDIRYDGTLPYGYHDVVTRDGGKLYLWLPQNSNSTAKIDVIMSAPATTYTKTWARTGTSETQVLLRVGNAAAPIIITQPIGGTYSKDSAQSLSISAGITDEGTLSYLWYENTGGISVGTNSTYALDTSAVGTKYYYCIVTNTNSSVAGTQTAEVTSTVAEVQIIDVPTIGNITAPAAVFVGDILFLSAVPTVSDNGAPTTVQGWEISGDGGSTWSAFPDAITMTYAHNGQSLRYYAINSEGKGVSNSVTITVNKRDLSTLSVSCANIFYGGTVNPVLSGNAGSGAVTWEYKLQSAPVSDYSGVVPTGAGAYDVRATVAETDAYNGGAATASFYIWKTGSALFFAAAPAGGSLASDDVTLRAELIGVSLTDYPTGSILFKNGSAVLGTVPLVNGVAEYLWEDVPFGTHNLTAEYAGDSNYMDNTGSISGYNVQKKTQAALEITGIPATVIYGDDSFDLGTAGGSGDGAVTYLIQSGDAVSVSGSTVTIEEAGTAVLLAVKAEDSVYNQTDAIVVITVERAEPGITLTADPAGGSLASDDVTLTAELTGVSPTDHPTGYIVFSYDGTVLDVVPVVNGTAEYLWDAVPFGTYDLKAEYIGDNNYTTNISSILGYEVEKKTQAALEITGIPATIVYGDSSFDLGTTGGSGDGGVTYLLQSGDAVSVSGNTVTIAKAGTAVLQAVKAADEVYNETAAVVTVTVKKAVPTVQENPATGGANVGAKLSAVSLTGISVLGVNGSPLAGSFAWENPETVIQGAGKHTAVFIPDSANYEAVSFGVQVRLATEKPVITEIKATPKGTDGAALEVTATGSTSLTYQWQVWGSWTDIPGATTAAYTYTGLAANTAYTVRVIVTDANGNSTTSQHITFQTGAAAITGLPGSYTLAKGSSVSWTPQPAGGTWKYDADYLTLSEKDGTATFTAKKVGKTTVTYTAGGTEFVITLTVHDSDSPKTGDDSSLGWYLVFGFAALCGLGVLAGLWNRRRKKEN